jgi:protein-S-isoprenylcysteine O-methyltransferase Ste14
MGGRRDATNVLSSSAAADFDVMPRMKMKPLELKIPPVIIFLIIAGLMWLVSVTTDDFAFLFPGRIIVARFLVFVGAGAIILGAISFRRAKTTVNPMKPELASSLVVGGIYKITRNPMYLGILLILFGWAIFLSNPISFSLIVAYIVYMNRFQIVPEERALEAQFQEEFRAYKTKVRRWL